MATNYPCFKQKMKTWHKGEVLRKNYEQKNYERQDLAGVFLPWNPSLLSEGTSPVAEPSKLLQYKMPGPQLGHHLLGLRLQDEVLFTDSNVQPKRRITAKLQGQAWHLPGSHTSSPRTELAARGTYFRDENLSVICRQVPH